MATERAQPYTFDLGHLLCIDPNPLPSLKTNKEEVLTTTARDCAQSLIHQLLSTCPISRAEDDGALQITLPTPETPLPREKHVPKEKEKTKWERFAEKKGIKAKRKDGKLVYNEEKKDWVPKYGYKGKKGDGVDQDWLVEVDDKAEKKAAVKGGEERKAARAGSDRRDKKMKMRKGK